MFLSVYGQRHGRGQGHDLGRQYLQPQSGHKEESGQNLQDFLRTVGLDNGHVYYGTAQL
ncbi:MAG: hypothetical protein R6V55_02985 [Desulfovermiculus sp.]